MPTKTEDPASFARLLHPTANASWCYRGLRITQAYSERRHAEQLELVLAVNLGDTLDDALMLVDIMKGQRKQAVTSLGMFRSIEDHGRSIKSLSLRVWPWRGVFPHF